ncbi:hypothetical protein N5853_00330 [Bartonella sp. HY329]|uniref:hypothetical protein n=1 Tax=unclassified Bartonella TaxID=2645622 RepID=UPI0021C9DC41|nr:MULTISPECIES: hypothetical protein [unclassified Bartonella]UXM95145.1 hypothetical protein N5853_00330 [Bartonella sp. HY329]UXN09468.1 hypothetical protein N5852_00335 [Bartonella sp. HY328]
MPFDLRLAAWLRNHKIKSNADMLENKNPAFYSILILTKASLQVPVCKYQFASTNLQAIVLKGIKILQKRILPKKHANLNLKLFNKIISLYFFYKKMNFLVALS